MGGCQSSLVSKLQKDLGGSGCDKSKEGIVHVVNTMTSKVILKHMASCNSANLLNQDLEVTCRPSAVTRTEDGTVLDTYEENKSCTDGMHAILNGMIYQFGTDTTVGLEEVYWKDHEVKVRTKYDQQMQDLLDRYTAIGTSNCKACLIDDVTQSSMLSSESNCYSTDTYNESFKSQVGEAVTQQLIMNQDVLNGAIKSLEKPGVKEISEDISSKIAQNITQNFMDDLSNTLSNLEVISINSQTAIKGNQLTQHSAFSIVMKKVTEQDLATKILTDQQWSIMGTEIDNHQELDEIGQAIFKTTINFAHTIDNTAGYVLIGVASFMGLLILIIMGHSIYKIIEREKIHQVHNDALKQLHKVKSLRR